MGVRCRRRPKPMQPHGALQDLRGGDISKTATGGEINVLDPGAFGAVTITKAISIISLFEAGVLATLGTNGIIINTPAASKVLLQGLDIEGVGTGLHGVRIIKCRQKLPFKIAPSETSRGTASRSRDRQGPAS